MLGYIIAGIIGILVIGFAFSSLSGGNSASRKQTPAKGKKSGPVQANEPAADEPTPDRSRTASKREIETAKQHTPPA